MQKVKNNEKKDVKGKGHQRIKSTNDGIAGNYNVFGGMGLKDNNSDKYRKTSHGNVGQYTPQAPHGGGPASYLDGNYEF